MRLTIDFGIDLGTTNSAIAVQIGEVPKLLADARGDILLPSVVHMAVDGAVSVGREALESRITDPANTAAEFKRLMGTNSGVDFPRCGKRSTPEELSAVILRSLAERAKSHGEPALRAAVITIPAMFQIPQCEATRKAAALAGIEYAPLLQEPIAAAIAQVGSGVVKDGYWLIYDLGGGTFDVSLVRSRGGRLQVLDHDGDNQLGGKDFNRALAREAATAIRNEGRLGAFSRSDPAYAEAFARLNAVAEQVRIRLSSVEQTEFAIDRLGKDSAGEWVGLNLSVDRERLIALLTPIVKRTIELCQTLIARNRLTAREIQGMVMVGGPTRSPFLPPMLESALGIRARQDLDPMTVVAVGAAIYASTQKLPSHVRPRNPSAKEEEVSLQLEFESMTTNPKPRLAGQLRGGNGRYSVQVKADNGPFTSNRLTPNAQGAFSVALALQEAKLNSFHIDVFQDSSSEPVVRSQFNIMHGLSIGKPPLSQSVGVMLANNTTLWYLRKGESLPARKTVVHATTQALRRGQSADAINVPLVQGEHDRADRNRVIGILRIPADQLTRDLPAGSEIEVTMEVDEVSRSSGKAYVPLLDMWFADVATFQTEVASVEKVTAGVAAQRDRLSSLQSMALALEGKQVDIDDRLKQVDDLIDEGDQDAIQLAEQLMRVATAELDQVEKQAGDQQLSDELDSRMEGWLAVLASDGNPGERQEFDLVVNEFRHAMAHGDRQLAQAKYNRCDEIIQTVVRRTPRFWIGILLHLIERMEQLGLKELAKSDIEAGILAAQKEDVRGLMESVFKLIDRLPRNEKENLPVSRTITSQII